MVTPTVSSNDRPFAGGKKLNQLELTAVYISWMGAAFISRKPCLIQGSFHNPDQKIHRKADTNMNLRFEKAI